MDNKKKEIKRKKYCPVCEKIMQMEFDFCPVHPTVLLVSIRDWGDGYKFFTTQAYDEQDDDFRMNEGLDRDKIEGAGGLTWTQLGKLTGVKVTNPLIAEWRRRQKK